MEIRQNLRTFLGKHIQADSFSDEDNFFEKNLVNSLFAMHMVTFLEKNFDIIFDNDELEIENFQSVNTIVTFIESKLLKEI